MPSFRSILTFAAAALVGFASAAPATANPEALATPFDVRTPSVAAVERRCARGCQSVPDVFVDLKADIDILTTKCHNIKPINGVVDIDAHIAILADVRVKVNVAVDALKAFVGVKADVLLLHDGKLLDINLCAKIVVDAIVSITALLKVVITACAQIDVVLKVIAEVNILVAALLTSVFACLDVTIKVAICGLLKVYISVLANVKLVDVVAIVKAAVVL